MSNSEFDLEDFLRGIGGDEGRSRAGRRGRRGGSGGEGEGTGRPSAPPIVRRTYVLIGVLALLFFGIQIATRVYTEWLWFESLGRETVYRTRVVVPIALFIGTILVAAPWLAGNWLLASRRLSLQEVFPGQRAPWAALGERGLRLLALVGSIGLAGTTALGVAGSWSTVMLYRARQEYGVADPIFDRDVGFYVFELPFYQLIVAILWGLLSLALLGTFVMYTFGGLLDFKQRGVRVLRPARVHLALLAALGALLWSAGQWLARFDVLYTTRASGAFYGAGYSDIAVRLPGHGALMWAGVLAAVAFVAAAFGRRLFLPALALGLLIGMRIVLIDVVPSLVQRFRVTPDELSLESPYIAHNIEMTRAAFGLDEITEVAYAPEDDASLELFEANQETIKNIRLWDWRALKDTFRQLQEIRPYYEFLDVDVDRYPVGGETRQVLLSARELTPAQLSNRTWVNQHLKFTHGFGAVVTPVDEVDRQGLPVLWSRDIPPVSRAPFEHQITEPRIYFGEAPSAMQDYVIVGTRGGEFDYSTDGDEEVETVYAGVDGVTIGSRLRRLLFALRFGDLEVLLSDEILPDSRILFRRAILQRANALAPFLVFDPDPYLVIDDAGRLVWILDAYSVTDRYPYSQPIQASADLAHLSGANSLRNSVKAVVDAYDGTTRLFIIDPNDPIVSAWAEVHPDLFEPASAMPKDLVAHWRYPETLFRAQSAIYLRYHMDTPDAFFRTDDEWRIPTESFAQGAVQPVMPYYVTMRLRGEERPEFLLMLPFTPKGRENLSAWLAARSDPEHYGQLVLYRFPRGRQFFGPQQIESRIDQDTEISQQLTLWGQSGSQVIRGNLLVIPIEDVLLYVEPLFLKSDDASAMPELKRVIVADSNRIVMRETLDEALAALVAAEPVAVILEPLESADEGDGDEDGAEEDGDSDNGASGASETGDAQGAEPPERGASGDVGTGSPSLGITAEDLLDADVVELVRLARDREAAAAQALQRGDWTAFGREMDALQRVLDALAELTGAGDGEAGVGDGVGSGEESGAGSSGGTAP